MTVYKSDLFLGVFPDVLSHMMPKSPLERSYLPAWRLKCTSVKPQWKATFFCILTSFTCKGMMASRFRCSFLLSSLKQASARVNGAPSVLSSLRQANPQDVCFSPSLKHPQKQQPAMMGEPFALLGERSNPQTPDLYSHPSILVVFQALLELQILKEKTDG